MAAFLLMEQSMKLIIKQFALLFFLSALVSLSLFSCQREKQDTVPPDDPSVVQTLFQESAVYDAGEADAFCVSRVMPYVNPTTGSITACYYGSNGYELITFGEDGEILAREKVGYPAKGTLTVLCGFIREDEFRSVIGLGGENLLFVWDRQKKEASARKKLGSIDPALDSDEAKFMASVGERTFCLATQSAVFLLDGNGNLLRKGVVQNWISDIAVSEEGEIYVCSNFNGEWSAARFNRDMGRFDNPIPLEPSTRSIAFGPEGALYFDHESGISRLDLADPKAESEPFVNYPESAVVQFNTILSVAEAESLAAVTDENTVLFLKYEEGRIGPRLARFTRADFDPSAMTELVMVHSHSLSAETRTQIVGFRKTHPDIRLTVMDYSVYDNNDNETLGTWRMMTDLLNGLISPDLVIGASDDEELRTLAERGFCLDLLPYLKNDPDLGEDGVFACVRSAYDNGRGGMWGISPYFYLRTLTAKRDLVESRITFPRGGEVNGAVSYPDFFALAASVPEGGILCERLRADWWETLFRDLTPFIDVENGVCSFDSADFVGMLGFIRTLPDAKSFGKTPFASAAGEQLTAAYRDGSVLLRETGLYSLNDWYRLEGLYGTPDYVSIGFPAGGEPGLVIGSSVTVTVMKQSAHPDACWELTKALLYGYSDGPIKSPGLPALRSVYDTLWEKEETHAVLYEMRGRTVSDSYAKNAEAGLKEDGSYMIVPGAEHKSRLTELLDTPVTPLLRSVPKDVMEIINEEISAHLAGRGTAEDCAGKIQSRASIWLAEHK